MLDCLQNHRNAPKCKEFATGMASSTTEWPKKGHPTRGKREGHPGKRLGIGGWIRRAVSSRRTVSLPGSQARQTVSLQRVWVSMTRQSSPCSGLQYQLSFSIDINNQLVPYFPGLPFDWIGARVLIVIIKENSFSDMY